MSKYFLNKPSKRVSWVLRHILRFTIGKSSLNVLRRLFNAFVVDCHMLCSIGYKEIFDSIISFNLIQMVDYFIRLKISVQALLHNKSMFTDVTLACCFWMIGFVYVSIASYFMFSTSPLRIRFTEFVIAFYRTISFTFGQVRNMYFERFTAGFTNKLDIVSYPFAIFPHKCNYRLREY